MVKYKIFTSPRETNFELSCSLLQGVHLVRMLFSNILGQKNDVLGLELEARRLLGL